MEKPLGKFGEESTFSLEIMSHSPTASMFDKYSFDKLKLFINSLLIAPGELGTQMYSRSDSGLRFSKKASISKLQHTSWDALKKLVE